MGGGSKAQVSEVKLPAWVESASQENYNFAKDVANQPYQPYTGQTVAGFSPMQNAAFDYGANNIGAYQGVYDGAIGMAANAGNSQTPWVNDQFGYQSVYSPNVQNDFRGYAPTPIDANQANVTAPTFRDADVSAYMNPYLDQVESYALQNLQAGTQQGLNNIGDQAARAGAFGGSRQGVQEGALMGDAAKRAGELSANVRAQGYDRALQQITADQNRQMQGSLANQAANMQGQIANRDTGLQLAGLDQRSQLANQAAMMQAALANQSAGLDTQRLGLQAQMSNQQATQNDYARQLQAALGMGQLGDQANAAIGTDLARLLSIGGMQQEQEQRYLDDDYGRFVEARDYPLEQLNTRLAALGMSPYGRTQTTTQSGGGMDFGGILGGAGSFLGGVAKIAPFFMGSDKSMKTDIQKMGKDKETGLDVYSYRYKGDPKSYPKVVGLMADDIEEKMPEAVKEVGGKKAVKFDPTVPKNRIAKKKAKA